MPRRTVKARPFAHRHRFCESDDCPTVKLLLRSSPYLALAVALAVTVRLAGIDSLAEGFRRPPTSARPLVFWQWMNGCVTKEGITSDLESFKRVGIGGVQQFLVGGSEAIVTDPTVQVFNPKWRELMRFAIEECARLGLSFGTHNCPGWSASGGPGVQPADAMKKLVWTVTEVEPGAEVELATLPRPAADDRYYRDVQLLAMRDDEVVTPQEVQVLSGARWKAPMGRWKIYHFGETLTGSVNGTAPLSGQGLEVDKLSRESLERFWATYPGQLVELAGAHAGRVFKRLELDSYEAGPQEWTTDALMQFSAICGYDARPWLPALAGATVGSAEATRRFREDWQLVVAHLLTENYFGHLGELTRRTPGMEFLLEPYATGQGELFNTSDVSAKADQLMCEFWWGPTTWGWDSIKPVASAVHAWGKGLVLAEAFTGQPQYAWRVAPFDLKQAGDRAFTMGVNQVILHAAAHQPWPGLKPGMTMGWWGTQFGPGQTWWEHGGPEWLGYLSRCQFLLQQGLFVGDLAWFTSERKTPAMPAGFDGDSLGEQLLLQRLAVQDDRLVLPGGMSYRALILAGRPEMKLEVLEKLRQLVEQGAVIAGPRPQRMLGQRGGMVAEAKFQHLADEMWGADRTAKNSERRIGRGRVLTSATPEQVLHSLGCEPDVRIESGSGVVWTHRRTTKDDLYFLTNQGAAATIAEISFRAVAPEVEFWDPDTGEIERCSHVAVEAGRTRVRLALDAFGSCFVVFRVSPTEGRAKPTEAETLDRQEITGAWQLRFPAGLGAPAEVALRELLSWPDHSDPGVRHFSGTATYARTVHMPDGFGAADHRLFLDLGRVRHIAEVRLNGVVFPALWKPPYRLDVTTALRSGENQLEIQVTNLWPNRMIGDAREPEDAEWGPAAKFKYVDSNPTIGRPLLKIPDWVSRGTARPSPGRVTFSTYDFFEADAPLLESGLLGPVFLERVRP
jgi:hypothetical protein